MEQKVPTQNPTPISTKGKVNITKQWKKLKTHPQPPTRTNTPTLPEQTQAPPPLKYPNTTTYYTDGSLILGKAGFGVYQPHTNYAYAVRLPGRQNILLAEVAAILHALTQARDVCQPKYI